MPLLLLFALIISVFFVFFSPIRVQGPSMVPTLMPEDRVLITHGDKDPSRGDVIVLIADENGSPIELVKRVIGLPGDIVEIKGDTAYVNGVHEPERGQMVYGRDPTYGQSTKVAPGQLFVMGDNRAVSEDSRYIGTVPLSGVKGKVVAVFAPIQRMRFVH